MHRSLRAILFGCIAICCLIPCASARAQDASTAAGPTQNPSTAPQKSPPENPEPNTQEPNEEPTPAQKLKDLPSEAEKETEKIGEEALVKAREWEMNWLAGPYSGRQRPLLPLTNLQRENIYLQQTFSSPSPYLKRLIVASVDQWRDVPPQWGDGWGAYGKRFASRQGQFIAANTLAALGDAKLKYDPMYDQCECGGFWPRARHAILRNFLTYNSSERELRPQWALYGGAFAGGVLATTWRPSKYGVLTNGAFAMVGQAGYGSLLNIFIEFAVDINRKMGGKGLSFQQVAKQ
jgi:hypothetical protein